MNPHFKHIKYLFKNYLIKLKNKNFEMNKKVDII